MVKLRDLNPAFADTYKQIGSNANLYDRAIQLLESGEAPEDMRPYLENFAGSYGKQLESAYNFSNENGLLDHPDVVSAFAPYVKSKAAKAAMASLQGANEDIMTKLGQLGERYAGQEKDMMADIEDVRTKKKQANAAEAQEKTQLAQGLTSRRGFGTEAMAQNALADIENTNLQQDIEVDSAMIDKALAAQNMYNQLVQNLFLEYKNTKSTEALTNLQTAITTLAQINEYIGKTK